jgi:hypothetical protein
MCKCGARDVYDAYEKSLICLDEESWDVLKQKAIKNFKNGRENQRFQNGFNQLNEAFAYRYLIGKGYNCVRILCETKIKQPDIEYYDGETRCFCEVKTLGISNDEIDRRFSGELQVYDTHVAYRKLSDGFLGEIEKYS